MGAIRFRELGVFNPMDPEYGAKGDGVTNDRVALQACMTACNTYAAANGSATFDLPNRVFLANNAVGVDFTATLTPASGVRMVSQGGTLKSTAGGLGPIMVSVNGKTGVIVDGFKFDMGSQTDALAVRVNGATNHIHVRNCTFDNYGTAGVYLLGACLATNIGPNNVFIGGQYQILFHDSSTALRTKIFNNTFNGNSEASEGIEVNTPTGAAQDTQITGNTFTAFAASGAGFVAAVGIAHGFGINVVGNTFTDMSVAGVRIEDGSQVVNVVGNEFNDVTDNNAVYAVLGSRAQNTFNIVGNQFTRCGLGTLGTSHVIFFEPGGVFNPWHGLNISDNQFFSNGNTTANSTTIRINGYLSNSRITDNTFRTQLGTVSGKSNAINVLGDAGTGTIEISGNTISDVVNGVITGGLHSDTTVRHNRFASDVTTPINNSATGTIKIYSNEVAASTAQITDGVRYVLLSFIETAGAGTYTATAAIPAGAAITVVSWETLVAWGADTTTIDLGYTGALTAFGNDINVDAVGEAVVVPVAAAAPVLIGTSAVTFTATLTTTGAGTTAGRTYVLVGYTSPSGVQATKV